MADEQTLMPGAGSVAASQSGRLPDLEQRFAGLMTRLADSPEKEALSILHGMLHEALRRVRGRAMAARESTKKR